MKSEKPTFSDWIHLKKAIDFSKAPWLGGLLGAALLYSAIAIFLICLFGLWHLLAAFLGYGQYASDATGSAIRNIGLVLAAAFSAPFLVWRSVVAQKNADTAVQSQITDRINKAVEGLGTEKLIKQIVELPRYKTKDGKWLRDEDGNPISAVRPDGQPLIDRETHESSVPNLEVRIGAIYALERIAQDSMRDHLQIMEILCAYVRENAPASNLEPTEPPLTKIIPKTDIQVVINVLGRRSEEQLNTEQEKKFRLDLRNADLSGIDFRHGNFNAALLINCRFEAALFGNASLEGTLFYGALLNFAEFADADLKGTRFDFASINRPKPQVGSLAVKYIGAESISLGNIYGISLVAADISAVHYLGSVPATNLTFGSSDTQLSSELAFERDESYLALQKIEGLRSEREFEKAAAMEADLYSKSPFTTWVPFDGNDLDIGSAFSEFQKRLGLVGWPHQG
ncbi:pentapeptide repeat-containing protein [Pseudovibrio sp. Tun.PSC04-5.I4]|uniref:pentapeptide repeat-containing protein n=1 Tax=Pseudovibrio sp. Tun.PSC04-5.I4 TaxID=1798213 RepID=UPI000884261F|nr:pentapeptide repeat-containing protein [Pseudovibrio sp. Tun.PSC04-5.I4]SDQ73031.1 Pentapeptide repeat-containing protein [Pseudovibrio sp. Tun.PSC04-5.I4]